MAKKETAQAPAKKKAKQEAAPFTEPARLRLKYKEIIPQLVEKFGYENPMQVPKLEKIVLNMGLGSDKDNPKGIDAAVEELGIIAGQKPVITKAKKSVANFKVRQGMHVGAKVTLRGDRMYYFADKLMNIVLPRVRDFRGVSDTSFDGRGNYAMGLKEQLIFPEINYDDVDKVRGMDVIFVTTAKTDEEAKELLRLMGMPFGRSPREAAQSSFCKTIECKIGNTWYVIETECDGNEPLTDKVKRLIFSDKGVIC